MLHAVMHEFLHVCEYVLVHHDVTEPIWLPFFCVFLTSVINLIMSHANENSFEK